MKRPATECLTCSRLWFIPTPSPLEDPYKNAIGYQFDGYCDHCKRGRRHRIVFLEEPKGGTTCVSGNCS